MPRVTVTVMVMVMVAVTVTGTVEWGLSRICVLCTGVRVLECGVVVVNLR